VVKLEVITESEHYDNKSDDKQTSACRGYVFPIVVRNKKQEK
jgi:hypothetical protein